MSHHTWTLEKFRHAGRSHLESARHVLGRVRQQSGAEPALIPASAAYLTHVALECAMKARLLQRSGCASAEDLQRKNPRVHDALFRGKDGHNLQFLAQSLRLQEVMKLEGKGWVSDECWERITGNERPYSLRYGAEPIEQLMAEEELQRASEILATLLSGMKSVRFRGAKNTKGKA